MAVPSEKRRARQEEATTLPPAERAREIAIRLLTNAPRSAHQLRTGMLARDVEPELVETVIARYIEVGLIDDAALAATIARTRHAERGVAARVIAMELRRKGFCEADVEAAVAQIEPADESAAARSLAERRWARTAGLAPEVRVRRLVAHLGRKGYSPSLAFALVKDLRGADIEGTARIG